MQYFGGKQRIAKRLADWLNTMGQGFNTYVEPFVGSAALMCQINTTTRIGNDANKALITMWLALAKGWNPPEVINEADYARIKQNNDPEDPLTAFVGFGCSFAGKWFGGYARGGVGRNYAANAASSLRKKMQGLANVRWCCGDYRDLDIPANAIIYCDPPYAGTTQYGATKPFDWDTFWAWCRVKAETHLLYISEYAAPSDFETVLTITTKTDIRTNAAGGQESREEKLFTYIGGMFAGKDLK